MPPVHCMVLGSFALRRTGVSSSGEATPHIFLRVWEWLSDNFWVYPTPDSYRSLFSLYVPRQSKVMLYMKEARGKTVCRQHSSCAFGPECVRFPYTQVTCVRETGKAASCYLVRYCVPREAAVNDHCFLSCLPRGGKCSAGGATSHAHPLISSR